MYLALATGQGISWKHDLIVKHHKHVPNTTDEYYRQVFLLRYVNWFLTEPLLLITLALLSGLPGAHLVSAIAANWTMLAAGLLGTYAGHTSKRWVWFTISAIAYLTTVYQVGVNGSRAAVTKDSQTRRFFNAISGVALFVKVLYPVYVDPSSLQWWLCWADYVGLCRALAVGPLALRMGLDAETVMFAIYDIFTQGILGYWLLLAHDTSQTK